MRDSLNITSTTILDDQDHHIDQVNHKGQVDHKYQVDHKGQLDNKDEVDHNYIVHQDNQFVHCPLT